MAPDPFDVAANGLVGFLAGIDLTPKRHLLCLFLVGCDDTYAAAQRLSPKEPATRPSHSQTHGMDALWVAFTTFRSRPLAVPRMSRKLTLNFMDWRPIGCSTGSNARKVRGDAYARGALGPVRNSVDQRRPRRVWRLLRDLQLLVTRDSRAGPRPVEFRDRPQLSE